uniref:Uncharacterized protein n=1 Tax=Arundo donax TaxID=35708 RepID=A0A0A9ELT3_ARUDO
MSSVRELTTKRKKPSAYCSCSILVSSA